MLSSAALGLGGCVSAACQALRGLPWVVSRKLACGRRRSSRKLRRALERGVGV